MFEKPFDINVLNFSGLFVNLRVLKFLGESQILWVFHGAISRGVPLKWGQQSFSMNGQLVNILGFVGHIQFLSHILCSLVVFVTLKKKKKPLENVKTILSSRGCTKTGHSLLTPALKNRCFSL